MFIFYYFGLYWFAIMLIGFWYALLRRRLKEDALLPANVTRCSYRKIEAEISRLRAINPDHPAIAKLGTIKKLFVASWVTIGLGPLGMLWIMTFS